MTSILTSRHSARPNISVSNEARLPQLKRSLNTHVRRQQYDKIQQENQQMLKRLQNRKSQFNCQQWSREDTKRHRLVKQICEYPYVLRQRSVYEEQRGSVDSATSRGQHK